MQNGFTYTAFMHVLCKWTKGYARTYGCLSGFYKLHAGGL